MINTPEQNLTISELDLVRIEKVKTRLDNFIQEIDIHSKKLDEIKADCVMLESRKTYLEEQVAALEIEKANLIASNESIQGAIVSNKEALEKIQTESANISQKVESQKVDIEKRERAMAETEREIASVTSNLENRILEVNKNRVNVLEVMAGLSDLKNKIKW